MKRGIWIGLVAVLAFIAILIVRLPASWLSGYLPKQVSCAELAGTLWNGTCPGLVAQGTRMGDLTWQLRALPLLTGKISTHVNLQHPSGSMSADLDVRPNGDLNARALLADLAIDPATLPQIPPGVRGRVHADLARLRLEKETVTEIAGRIDVLDLERRGEANPALGSYSVTFPAKRAQAGAGELIGDLDSLEGPWQFTGTVRVTREKSVIEGLLAPGPGAPLDAVKELGRLGPPDAQGRRQFSVENYF